jgi:organic radical activating enzyme
MPVDNAQEMTIIGSEKNTETTLMQMFGALRHVDPRSERTTVISVLLGDCCTFACSYCPPWVHAGRHGWLPREPLLRFFARAASHYREVLGQHEVYAEYSGGEPTTHPDFLELLKQTRDLGLRQQLLSNGSASLEEHQQIAAYIDQIMLTYHTEYLQLERFMEVVELYRDRVITKVSIAVKPSEVAQCQDFATELHERFPNVSVTLKALRKNLKTELFDYAPADLALLEHSLPSSQAASKTARSGLVWHDPDGNVIGPTTVNGIIVTGRNHFSGWRCRAGIESLVVDVVGGVSRAYCRQLGLLGTLHTDVSFPREPLVCQAACCPCGFDLLVTKTSPEYKTAV